MTLIEAKETLAKAHMCHMLPIFNSLCKEIEDCEHCQLYVSPEKEQEAFDFLCDLMKLHGRSSKTIQAAESVDGKERT